jgi:hypothetical protein
MFNYKLHKEIFRQKLKNKLMEIWCNSNWNPILKFFIDICFKIFKLRNI